MPIRAERPRPAPGHPLPAAHECAATLDLLSRRRSISAKLLKEPGPDRMELEALLTLAMRVPDHRKLEPWRFIVVAGEARRRLGEAWAEVRRRGEPGAGEEVLAEDRARPLRAPVMVAVASSPVDDPKATPQIEQLLSAGAVCQTLLIACSAAGWAAVWITEWPAYDEQARRALGLRATESIAGFILIGTAAGDPPERERPDPGAKITWWDGAP